MTDLKYAFSADALFEFLLDGRIARLNVMTGGEESSYGYYDGIRIPNQVQVLMFTFRVLNIYGQGNNQYSKCTQFVQGFEN